MVHFELMTVFAYPHLCNPPPGIMVRVAVVVVLIALSSVTGCFGAQEEVCPEEGCFPLTSDLLNEILSDKNSFNVLDYANYYDRLSIETTSSSTVQGQFGEIHWGVSKDDNKQLRSISTRVTIGTYSYNNEVIDGGYVTNIRVGSVWFEGRDAKPEYVDPFVEFAILSSQGHTDDVPPFGFDTTTISNLDWRITGDQDSGQQVATTSNSTHSIIIELRDNPPRIMAIETYSGEEEQFVLKVRTGDEVDLQINEGMTRAPLGFDPYNGPTEFGGISVWAGAVPENLVSEANPQEIEIRGLSTNDTNAVTMASLRMDSRYSNVTASDGTWWEFEWEDRDSDDFVSAGDLYAVRTNSTGEPSIAAFDIWADSWTGGPLATL